MKATAAIAFVIAFFVLPAAAAASPPGNDNRANANQVGSLPASVSGTTVEATDDPTDHRSGCGRAHDTVWYRLTGVGSGRIVVRVVAAGELDAVVSVYRAVRSRVTPAGCAATDEAGRGALSFTSTGGDYLVMVGRERASEDGRFRLTVFRQEPSSRPPGRTLLRKGVSSWVEPISDYDDAWSLRMKAGVQYRINLSPARGRCITMSLFRPGTRSFAGAPLQVVPCGGYFTYTPGFGGSGLYTLLVTASDQRPGRQRYHLQAAVTGADDSAPGLLLRNLQTRRGSVAGTRIDVVDLYRFRVAERADVALTLRGPASARLIVLNENGRRLSSSSGAGRLTVSLGQGTYFVAVRAESGATGRYRLSLLERGVTTTTVLANGLRSATVSPGSSVAVSVAVDSSSGGAVRLEIDRFDPLTGWHFYRLYRLRLGGDGRAGISWRPPSIGHWRVHASFGGTRTASPSDGGTVRIVVTD